MNSSQHSIRRMSKTQVGFGIATFVFGVLACTIGGPEVPQQEWWSDRGPVVPHDSFPADCSLCHVGEGWNRIRKDFEYDHLEHTGLALEGAHSEAECLRCHNDRGRVESFAARGCAGCHEDIHRGQLGRDCTICHGERDWRPTEQIAQHNRTRFPLVGAHAATACWRCHPGAQVGNFARADAECITCHATELQRATTPPHLAQGWTDRCDRCHIPTSWTGAGFNHGTWPLTGAHAAANCTQCHPGQTFAGTPRNCAACHIGEYNQVTDPNHVALNFPTNCSECHGTSSWTGAHFNHSGLTQACVDCHLAEYQNTTNPNHASAGFQTNCESCHNTNTWQGAMFSHAGITNGCVDCHLAEYQSTTNPNHASAGFPTTCESCHNTNTWNGAAFNHSFPINSGAHKKFNCADCHLNQNNYAQFSCIHCHDHNQQKMGNKHSSISGYAWQSNACLACHPNGKH